MNPTADEKFMTLALDLARAALERGDTPVGSVVVRDGKVIGEGVEAVRTKLDPAAHAEIVALQDACRGLASLDLTGCVLYTTAEPCLMCSFAIRSTRISRVVIGKPTPHVGGFSSKYPILKNPEIPGWREPPAISSGVMEEACAALFAR
ncbi:MAG TPA: nucleoside deaminase [Terriglobia bacterium]|nr:nucleoside deaminase [Terriglobia bacterium]